MGALSGPPVLYSFRRCPYAMRARLALAVSGQRVALREVKLARKPAAFLEASPSGTVPCLVHADGVIDESLDVMKWALGRRDPERWLRQGAHDAALIAQCDGAFKHHLDRTKYPTRYDGEDPQEHRAQADATLFQWDHLLTRGYFGGAQMALADAAILPFVRQFAFIDKARFDGMAYVHVKAWLERFLLSDRLAQIMHKYTPWQPDDPPIYF